MKLFLPQKSFNDLDFADYTVKSYQIAESGLFDLYFELIQIIDHFKAEILNPLFIISIIVLKSGAIKKLSQLTNKKTLI